jgi:hypothetical protein
MNLKIKPFVNGVAITAILLTGLPNTSFGQETVQQTYTKETEKTRRCLNEQDIYNLAPLDKISFLPYKETKTYSVYKQGTQVTKVVTKVNASTQIKYGMCLPEFTQFSNSTIVNNCGQLNTINYSAPNQIASNEMIDKSNLFNYTADESLFSVMRANNISYKLLSDGTLEFWLGNQYKSLNKSALIEKEMGVVAGKGAYQKKRMFRKFSNNQVLLVCEEEDSFDTLANGIVVADKIRYSYKYPSLSSANGKVLESIYLFPSSSDAKVIAQHNGAQTEEDFAEAMRNPDLQCMKEGFEALYDILGKEQSRVKTYDAIYQSNLINGVYMLKYKCGGKQKSKKIIIQ